MQNLKTKYEFDRWAKALTAVASATIVEALGGPDFRDTVVFSEHRRQIAIELLTRRPALVGTLPATAATDAKQAVEQARVALLQLRAEDEPLFWHSRTTAAQCRQWVLKAFVGRQPDEVFGLCDRADDLERISLRYTSVRRLLAEGEDIYAIREEIERKHPTTNTAEYVQRAVAQTPSGLIAGHNQS